MNVRKMYYALVMDWEIYERYQMMILLLSAVEVYEEKGFVDFYRLAWV